MYGQVERLVNFKYDPRARPGDGGETERLSRSRAPTGQVALSARSHTFTLALLWFPGISVYTHDGLISWYDSGGRRPGRKKG